MAKFISDEEMAKLESQKSSITNAPPNFISDEDMQKLEMSLANTTPQNNSDMSQYFQEGDPLKGEPSYSLTPEAASKFLETVDKYTGAPIRKFVTEKVSGKALEKAPTGKEQAMMMGLSDQEYNVKGAPWLSASPAGAVGVGLELLQDPFVIASLASKGLKSVGSGLKSALTGEQAAEATAKAAAGAKSVVDVAQEASQMGKANASASSSVSLGGGNQTVKTQFSPFEIKAPQSLKELEAWEPPKNIGKMQAQRRLGEIEAIVPDLEVKPLNYHYAMLENPKSMRALKNNFENLTSPQKYKIATYNLSMLDDAERKALETIESISNAPFKSIPDQGNSLINKVKDVYKTQKDVLKPYFEKLKKAGPLNKKQVSDLKVAIAQNSKAGPLIDIDESGNMLLKPNTTKTGLSDKEYDALKRVFNDLDGKVTFQEMQRMRDFLRKQIDITNPAATEELQNIRKILLDQLEFIGQKKVPQMRDVFKDYAINERNLDNIENIIGGKIESLDSMYSANPDKIVGKILSNPNYQDIVKSYIGDDAYNEMIKSYLNLGFRKSFDNVKGFMPQNLRAFLKQNENVLLKSIGEEQYQRLSALADHGYLARRFLDEVNPSGTAESLLSALKPGSFTQEVIQKGPVSAVKQKVYSSVLNKQKQIQSAKAVNEALAYGSAEAGARSSSSASQKIFQGIKDNLPQSIKNINLNDLIKAQAGASSGRSVLNNNPKLLMQSDSDTKKGKEKWANDGFDKILQHSNDTSFLDLIKVNREKLFSDPKNKELLIQASDLKPGSKAMEKVVSKIKSKIAVNERSK